MNLKKCSTSNCSRTDIVAMQRQIEIETISDQLSPMKTIVFKYFCKIHFDRNELLKRKVKFVSATSLSTTLSTAPDTTRKRKTNTDSDEYEKSYTLNETTNSDNTKVNLSFPKFPKFDSEDYEDSDPLTFMEIESDDECAITSDDNDQDCIITGEPSKTVIDLSDDDGGESGEGSKMIELIMCNETEPEPLEMPKEYIVEITDDCENEGTPQPLQVNFKLLRDDAVADGNDIDRIIDIDLTADENDKDVEREDANPPEVDKEQTEILKCRNDETSSIDLSDDTAEDETNVDVERYRTSVIEKIRRQLRSKYPQVVQTISWNDNSKQFEVSISKKNGFKVDGKFQQFLRETVNDAVQSSGLAKGKTKHSGKGIPSNQVNKKKLPDFALKPKSRVVTNENGNSSNTLLPVVRSKSSKNQIDIEYNANQILEKAQYYLGVSAKTFLQLEAFLPVTMRNRPMLVLLLRKIKLNEPFSILSDLLCPDLDPDHQNCINLCGKYLEKVSRTLKTFLQPDYMYGRKSLAIVDVLEIEIGKPKSKLQQSLSFCNQRQRYLIKFIICFTSTGVITHLSPAFYIVNSEISTLFLAKIPKSYGIVANPNLFKFGLPEGITSLFDCHRQAERNISQRVLDRMRSFSLINSIVELKNGRLMEHTVSLVASLCNMQVE